MTLTPLLYVLVNGLSEKPPQVKLSHASRDDQDTDMQINEWASLQADDIFLPLSLAHAHKQAKLAIQWLAQSSHEPLQVTVQCPHQDRLP